MIEIEKIKLEEMKAKDLVLNTLKIETCENKLEFNSDTLIL